MNTMNDGQVTFSKGGYLSEVIYPAMRAVPQAVVNGVGNEGLADAWLVIRWIQAITPKTDRFIKRDKEIKEKHPIDDTGLPSMERIGLTMDNFGDLIEENNMGLVVDEVGEWDRKLYAEMWKRAGLD